jgi:hypothetical protein
MTDSSPTIEVLPQPPRPKRGLRALVAGLAAVVLVGGTMVAVNAFGSDDTSSTPEAPVRALLAAASAGNVNGMLDQLAPGERDALKQPVNDLVSQLERLGILGKLDLGNVNAYKLKIDGLQLDPQTRRADLAFVKITGGTANYSFDPANLPLGSFLTGMLGPMAAASAPSSGSTNLASASDAGLITVKQDGHWYVSIGYTLAEQARTAAGVSLDALGQRVTPVGAATPEDAVRQLVQDGAKLDLRGVLGLLPPGEMGALQEYAGLFLPKAEAALAADADKPKVTVTTLDLSSKTDGDVATVTIDKLAGTAVSGDTTVTLADGCITEQTAGGAPQKTCGNDPSALLGNLGVAGLPGLGQLGAGATADVGIRVVKVDGKWYVSPVRTVLDGVVSSFDAIKPGDLAGLAQAIQGLTKTLESGGGAGLAPGLTPKITIG